MHFSLFLCLYESFWRGFESYQRRLTLLVACLAHRKQEDARRRLRGMCGFKKELRVCWMEVEVE